MTALIIANTGYYVGFGIEGFIILIAGVLLVLMLTGVFFKWLSAIKEKQAERAAAKAAAAEAAALAAEEEEAEEDEAEGEPEVYSEEAAEEEAAVAEVPEEAAEEVEEEQEQPEEENREEAEDTEEESHGIVFEEKKSITELYEELTVEQKGYFDELRDDALTKPDAELNISKNFITVKIGKRNLIKLLIKRGVTVAEFVLENEALKQLRLSNTNKRGKSAIKVKPTVVQVIDLASLKVAIDMINLAYEELMFGD